MKRYPLVSFLILVAGLILTGCGGGDSTVTDESESDEPFKIVLQTDWYAQPEHGGFYHAVANGYYAEEGLEVEILPGGPNTLAAQKIAQGTAQFAIGRSDEVIIGSERGVPLVIIGALMQKDPQAIMFHKESGIETLADLDGRAIMAGPGSAFLEILKLQYGIEFSVIPLDYGMSRFLNDKEFVQQCFITNEPFYVSRAGANVETILLSESGFRPYRVWFTSKSFLRRHPEKVAAFHRASIRGWQDYLFGDPTAANELIASRNPKMDLEFMAFVHKELIRNKLVTGDSGLREDIGKIEPWRIEEQLEQLLRIGMLEKEKGVEEVYYDVEAQDDSATTFQPLPVLDMKGDPIVELTPELLSRVTLKSAELPLETSDSVLKVKGVYLKDILEAADIPVDYDIVFADCSDGYQSNYSLSVLETNKPLLILEIEGVPVAEWCADKGRPEWGPFMIQLLEYGDLLDPVNKNPWGVQNLRIGFADTIRADLASKVEDWTGVESGFHIYMGNCASCHSIDSVSGVGGSVSSRPASVLAVLALHNESYVSSILMDPVGTNPLAEKMPSVVHYNDAQTSALLKFLSDYAM